MVMPDRLIAFLDVLGFGRRLESDLEGTHAKYAELIDLARKEVFQNQPGYLLRYQANFAKSVFIYDSVLLVSHPTDEAGAVGHFLLATTFLLERAFAAGLPLRGCIGFGDFLCDDDRHIYLASNSKVLVEKADAQDWSGCVVLPGAQALVLDATYCNGMDTDAAPPVKKSLPVVPFVVPFKQVAHSQREELWCLNWVYMLPDAEREQGMDYLKGAKEKHCNTKEFVEYVLGLDDKVLKLRGEVPGATRLKGVYCKHVARQIAVTDDGTVVRPGG